MPQHRFVRLFRLLRAGLLATTLSMVGGGLAVAVFAPTAALAKDGGSDDGGGSDDSGSGDDSGSDDHGGGSDDSSGDDHGGHGPNEDGDDHGNQGHGGGNDGGGSSGSDGGCGGMNIALDYADGFHEAVSGCSYVLTDRHGQVVIERRVKREDVQRIQALGR